MTNYLALPQFVLTPLIRENNSAINATANCRRKMQPAPASDFFIAAIEFPVIQTFLVFQASFARKKIDNTL
ncbi:hypothetical protein G6L63_17275 [Agrobacterium vitis]|uniref:Uncharacterized protein n=1 Tax=Agrobacterium vitis TaxID=373 RepID=A0A368NZ78_AGRVI|nr:hypothetical protein [Agrobacterium vitis]KAA3518413.1 hypothetical protein DXM22_04460 [Agrobacterium vitis]KAA3530010.1 hypothetical protein DXT89_04445 [Agrobacterium vitis]MCF1476636.1 hypothetical protein [Agrobacterium vitis]MUZ96168.1 hypothetical protein [Agrobacterium vitis]MVA29277.1 hypothetical protein [Agrobacterium vitis]